MKSNKVTLFSKVNCIGCARIRYFLRSLGIQYKEVYTDERVTPSIMFRRKLYINPDYNCLKKIKDEFSF